MRVYSLPLLLVLFLSISLSTATQQRRHFLTQSNKSRTDTLYARCPVKRDVFFNSQYNDSLSAGRVETAAALKLDGDALIYNLITKNNTGAQQEFNKSLGSFILYAIFMVFGLIFLLIIAPILICCYCKPEKCPPCLKCRVPEAHIYTNCERRWPSIPIIVLSIVVIGTMIAVMVVNPRLQKGYSDTRCAASILFDDLLNGNYTKDQSQYFIGLKPMQSKLTTLKSSVDGIFQKLQKLSGGSNILNYFTDQLNQLKHLVSDIPNGDGTGSQLDLSYQSPLNSNPGQSTQTVPSTFSDVLGSNADSFTLVGQVHTGLTMTHQALGLVDQLTNLAGTSLPKLSQTINSSFDKYVGLVDTVQKMDRETDDQLTTVQNSYITPLLIVIYIIASLALITSVLVIIGTCCICFKDKLPWSKVLFAACVVITFLAILCFILSLGMSAATAGSHYGCHYIEIGLQNKSQFIHRFKPIFKDNQVLTEMMAECACKQGSGILMNSTIAADLIKNPSSLGISHLSSLDTTQLSVILSHSKSKLQQTIASYQHSRQLDIESIADIKVLEKLSDPSKYTCGTTGFHSDSWVPSVDQDGVYVTCKIKDGLNVTQDTCQTQDDFQYNREGCSGCIDTPSMLELYNSYDEVLQGLNTRYWTPDCEQFVNDLANTWHNFYSKKWSKLSGIQSRAKQASQLIDDLSITLSQQLEPELKQTINHLQQSLNTITNTAQPIPDQINCKVLGEDVELITNTFCTQVFNYSFSMRILMMIAGFAMLVLAVLLAFYARRVNDYSGHVGVSAESQPPYQSDDKNPYSDRPMQAEASVRF